MIERAYVVPHPPIVLKEVGRGEEEKISATVESFKRLAKEIKDLEPETIIISSPHAPYYMDGFYISNGQYLEGDLSAFGVGGVSEKVEVDQDLVSEILKTGKDLPIFPSKTKINDLDHGALVPIRYIKEAYKDFKLIVIGISTLEGKDHYRLGQAIQKAVKNLDKSCVYIGSGDLSHALKDSGPYGYKEEGPIFDKKIVDILSRAAFDELIQISNKEADQADQCGLNSFQIMAGSLDGLDIKSEKYSYEGPFGVGYAVISYKVDGSDPQRKFIQKKEEKDPYIELARKTIETYIIEGKVLPLANNLPIEIYEKKAGCFVTLEIFGNLRGCIGTIAPTKENLGQEIIRNAIASSTEDPRFPPVGKDEIDKLDISVDILEKAEPINSIDMLDPKRYGVIVSCGYRKGLLLPNLQGVDTAQEQISIALSKAGIGPKEDYKLERFEVVRHEYRD